jgi:hypothetical protein
LNWLITLLLELKDSVFAHFFVIKFAAGFGPGKFSGVMFSLKVPMAFRPAEAEHFAIISHKHYTMAWIDRS